MRGQRTLGRLPAASAHARPKRRSPDDYARLVITRRRPDSRLSIRLFLAGALAATACTDAADPRPARPLEASLPDARALGEGWEQLPIEDVPPTTRPDASFCNMPASKVHRPEASARREYEAAEHGRAGVTLYRYGSKSEATARLDEYRAVAASCRSFEYVTDDGAALPATLETVERPAVGPRGSCFALSLREGPVPGWFGLCVATAGAHLVHTRSQSYVGSREDAVDAAGRLTAAAIGLLSAETAD